MLDDDGRFAWGMRDERTLVVECPVDRRVETHLMAPTAVTSRRLTRTSRTVVESDASRGYRSRTSPAAAMERPRSGTRLLAAPPCQAARAAARRLARATE